MDDPRVARCNLELDGLRSQRHRYRQLGSTARRIDREPQKLTVEFGPDVDDALLTETIAIESRCCPFFALRYDASTHELTARVAEPELDPALDALVAALGAPEH